MLAAIGLILILKQIHMRSDMTLTSKEMKRSSKRMAKIHSQNSLFGIESKRWRCRDLRAFTFILYFFRAIR